MEDLITQWQKKSQQSVDTIEDWLEGIDQINNDQFVSIKKKQTDLHTETFDQINCVSCANCCKTAPPLVSSSDIKRIAAKLGISKKRFRDKYVLEDINGEQSFNYVPCPFLEQNGACSIYDIRPEACRRYPHTDEASFLRRKKLNMANVITCPATYQVLKQLSKIPLANPTV